MQLQPKNINYEQEIVYQLQEDPSIDK